MSPHRKRTAAYTQATTKSSMKKGKRRDMSASSARKNKNGVLAPLGMSTPAKVTNANKSTIDDFERMEDGFDGDATMYGIPNTIGQIESNSALVNQLKVLLENAMERESHLADFIEKLCQQHLEPLTQKFENLKHAESKIREDSERLRMRNEELETRLLDAQSKLWTLKMMYDEYDQILEKMTIQKNENTYIHKEDKSDIMSAVDGFLSSHGIPRKKGKSTKTRSLLSSYKSGKGGKSTLRKKPSVRFKSNKSRSEESEDLSHTFNPEGKTMLRKRQSSRGHGASLRKSRSEAVRLGDLQSHEGTPSQRSALIRNNLRNQDGTPSIRDAGIQPSLRRDGTNASVSVPMGLQSPSRHHTSVRTRNNQSNPARSQHDNLGQNSRFDRSQDDRIDEEDNEDGLEELDFDDLEYYSNEGEEEEDEDDENVETHNLFDEANDYIDMLKDQLKQSKEQNNENDQTIQSLRNEIAELQKLNDNLENQLYKYQYTENCLTIIF